MFRLIQDCIPINKSLQTVDDSQLENWEEVNIDENVPLQTRKFIEFKSNDIKFSKGAKKLVDSHVGQGTFSNIYAIRIKGVDKNNRRSNWKHSEKAALKKFQWYPNSTDNDNRLTKMLNEAHQLFRLSSSHKSFLKFYGICKSNLYFGHILEFCEGGSLGSLCRSLPDSLALPLNILVDWSLQIVNGMNFLASQNIRHNNLKADNILIKEPVCMCSFSAILQTDVCSACGNQSINKLSLKIIGINGIYEQPGDIAWRAPELFESSETSKATEFSDIWSFGVLLWEIMNRDIPYFGLHPVVIADQIKNQKSTLELPDGCPKDLKEIIEECWSWDLVDRPTFQYLLWDLKEFAKTVKDLIINISIPRGRTVTNSRLKIVETSREMTKFSPRMPGKAKSLEDCHLDYGHFGNVYEVRTNKSESSCNPFRKNKTVKQRAAMKKIMIQMTDFQYEKLNEEAKVVLDLPEHENLLQLLGVSHETFYFGLIFELCEGGSLEKVVEAVEFLSFEILNDWAIQIARGMEVLQQNKIVHGDLQLGNVLVKDPVCYCNSSDSKRDKDKRCSKCKRYPLNNLKLKVANFGFNFSRSMTSSDVIIENGTEYSDVWAFGKLLQKLLQKTSDEKEDQEKEKLELLIGQCIVSNPCDRPNFQFLIDYFKKT